MIYADTGAYVMGRTMFDVGEEPWGDTPPFQAPVYVVTHRPREPLVRDGGTTFHFVTTNGKNVAISGGPRLLQQVIEFEMLGQLRLDIAPVLLGGGMRLFRTLPRHIELLPTHVQQSERATHITYTMSRDGSS